MNSEATSHEPPSQQLSSTRSEGKLRVGLLHPKQQIALESAATEVLYGGAAGGGKSHLMRLAAIEWCASISGLQAYIFRRIYEDLIRNHVEGPKGLYSLLAEWIDDELCEIVADEVRFWNGSKIYLCHCEHEKHIYKYQGAEIHVLLIDELTHFTETMYRFLRNRVRMVGMDLKEKYAGRFPRILCSANPGNIGHLWVKNTWISMSVPLEIRRMPKSEGGMLRQFVPARLEDNPSLLEDDPEYEGRLEGLGSKALVSAMRWGDWDIVEGAFFDCWSDRKHVIAPFPIPAGWVRFRSMDWGSASPFSVGWWAVVQDDFVLPQPPDDGDDSDDATSDRAGHARTTILPRGALVRYREYYGDIDGSPGKGLKLTAEEVAAGIIEREKDDPKLDYGVLDPSAFNEDGGPSIRQRLDAALYKAGLCGFKRADKARVSRIQHRDRSGPMGGWDQMRARMIGVNGRPMVVCFSTCFDSRRTIPTLQHDQHRAEDLDTTGEDHCFAAGTMVETDTGPVPIERLQGTSGKVLSVGGLQEYRSVRMTRRDARIARLTFDNGRSILCTTDHRFLVDFDAWKYARDLTGERVACARSSLVTPSNCFLAPVIISAVTTFNTKAAACISEFGNIITVLCQKAITFTTRMVTELITLPAILNASPLASISVDGMEKKMVSVGGALCDKLASQLLRGTDQRRAANGIEHNTKNIVLGSFMRQSLKPALSAKNHSRDMEVLGVDFARMLADPHGAARWVSITRPELASFVEINLKSTDTQKRDAARAIVRTSLALERGPVCLKVDDVGRADVYCLTVPSIGCFAIEGGIIVSNCADEWRYAVMSRPWFRTPDEKPKLRPDYAAPAEEIGPEFNKAM